MFSCERFDAFARSVCLGFVTVSFNLTDPRVPKVECKKRAMIPELSHIERYVKRERA